MERIFRNFTMGKKCRAVVDYDPREPKIHLSFLEKSDDGEMAERIWGDICRRDCERFALFLGQRFLKVFEIGKKQRIIIDYDPLAGSTTIDFQDTSDIRSLGSAGISDVSVLGHGGGLYVQYKGARTGMQDGQVINGF